MKLETKLKHTPGPWALESDKNYYDETYRYYIYDTHEPPKKEISMVETNRRVRSDMLLPQDTAQANARLIAAAPDLLDALMKATILLKHACDDAHTLRHVAILGSQFAAETADAMHAALTKAIGENQE